MDPKNFIITIIKIIGLFDENVGFQLFSLARTALHFQIVYILVTLGSH